MRSTQVCFALVAAAVLWPPAAAAADPGPPIYLNTAEGRKRLRESTAKESYVPLSTYFTTQETLTFCGPASLTVCLNATGIDRPVSEPHAPHRLFTQENLFGPGVREVIDPDRVRRSGMTLSELGKVCGTFPVAVEVVPARDTTLADFRTKVVKTLRTDDQFVLANYHRGSVGQTGGGHISPVAAYHEKTDSFLILDVARYRYEPAWVAADALFSALDTVDGATKTSRGIVIVGPKPAPPAAPK